MSSAPEDPNHQIGLSTPGSQLVSSQLSETIQGSQPSQVENELSLLNTQDESQDVSASFNSAISSTLQENASQSQPYQLFSQVTISSNTPDNDTSMMPPPTPGSINNAFTSGQARSSGRAIKPTLKLRGDSEEPFGHRTLSGSSSIGNLSGSQTYGFRGRKSTESGSIGNNSNSRARRLKVKMKDGHASRGKGDPTLSGVNKTLPYMQGYDRELDSSDEEGEEGMAFEEQIILRMPEGHEATKTLGDWIRRREVGNDGREVEVKFKDSRRAVFKVGDKQFSSKLVDLPAIIESHKTLDNKQLFKIADISQMLLVTHQIREESEVTREDGRDEVEGLTDDFVYDHGITPPMKWARKRRFRKRIHKRTIETVEKEVERLLAEDERAERVEYTMIDVAEADRDDFDDDGERDNQTGVGSPSASQGATPSIAQDGASVMSDMEDEFSQMGEQEESGMVGEDDDVDQDLQRELEEEMLLQQQEDEEDEEEDGSVTGGRSSTRGRSTSRAMSDEEEDDDDDEEDDLFDAGEENEGAAGATKEGEEGADDLDDDDDDDLDEEEQERRVRETQLEAECKEIEAMVKRKNTEVEGTKNEIIKKRNLQTLKRMQIELDMKKSQLIDLKQQRREGKEAAKAEAQAQAAEEEAAALAAAAAAASTTNARTSASATPSTAAVIGPSGNAPVTATSTMSMTAPGGANSESASTERDKIPTVAAKEAAPKSATIAPTKTLDVDDEEDEGEDQGSDESDLFG